MTITPTELRCLLSYDAETGELIWKARGDAPVDGQRAGKRAGCVNSRHGYISVMVRKRGLRAHRVAWAIHYGEWPDGVIDHVNGNPADNRIVNLRVATQSQNNMNRRRGIGSHGYKGVRRPPNSRAYYGQITYGGKQRSLGRFECPEDAARAYDEAAVAAFGEFAATNASLGLLPAERDATTAASSISSSLHGQSRSAGAPAES